MLLSRFLQHTGHRIGLEINSAKDLGHPQAQYWISHVWPNFFFFFICPRKWEHQSVHTVRAAVLQSAQYSVCRPASSLCVCVCVCVCVFGSEQRPMICLPVCAPAGRLLGQACWTIADTHTHTNTRNCTWYNRVCSQQASGAGSQQPRPTICACRHQAECGGWGGWEDGGGCFQVRCVFGVVWVDSVCVVTTLGVVWCV